jgi:hypothetical protein
MTLLTEGSMEAVLNMEEVKQFSVIERYLRGEVSLVEASNRLRQHRSTFLRRVSRFRAQGPVGLAHRLRGRASNNKTDAALKDAVCQMFRAEYGPHGFRVAHFYDDAAARFPHPVSYATVVRWLRAEGLVEKAHKGRRHHTRRPRKEAFGEMLQMDTSIHDWLGWGRNLALVTTMDDATNILCGAYLHPTDTTLANMRVMSQAFMSYGLPASIYVDKSPIFKVTRRGGIGRIVRPTFEAPYITQVKRALDELGVELIYAHSPQAKGRVERSYGTWQGRLVPELKKNGIRELDKANQYIQEVFLPKFNLRFALDSSGLPCAFIPLRGVDLDFYLAEKHSMRVTNDHILLSKSKGVSLRVLPSATRASYAKAESRFSNTSMAASLFAIKTSTSLTSPTEPQRHEPNLPARSHFYLRGNGSHFYCSTTPPTFFRNIQLSFSDNQTTLELRGEQSWVQRFDDEGSRRVSRSWCASWEERRRVVAARTSQKLQAIWPMEICPNWVP